MTIESTARWRLRRLLALVLICLAGAVAVGLTRGIFMFMPGILGMAAGGLVGYLCGRVARGDPAEAWTPGQRLWFAAGAAVLYGVTVAAVVSVVRAGPYGAPLGWLTDVVRGSEGEYFFGTSRNSYQAVSGTISGAWWFGFSLLDGVSYLALFFVSMVAALGHCNRPERATGEPDRPPGPDPVPVTPAWSETAGEVPRAGILAAAACVVAAGLVVAGLAYGPSLVRAATGAPSASETMWDLQGDWQFDGGASFLGDIAEERAFTLARVFDDELAGVSVDRGRFVMSLNRRSDGVFEGRIVVRGEVAVPVRMRPARDGRSLNLEVEWWGPAGRSVRRISAHRPPS